MLKLEFKKIKFTNILLISLIIPLLANTLGPINFMGNRGTLTNEWQSLWTQVNLFYFSFFYIPLIVIVIASLWATEHRTGLKFIRFSPKENVVFMGAKLILTFLIICLRQIYLLTLFYLGGKYIGGFSTINFFIYLYYIGLSTLFTLPIVGVFGALSIKIRSPGIIVLLSTIFTMSGFANAFRSLKIVGLSFLAIEANNLRFMNPRDLVLLSAFALGELFIFLYLSDKFLKFENK